jgi:hypothetical protein
MGQSAIEPKGLRRRNLELQESGMAGLMRKLNSPGTIALGTLSATLRWLRTHALPNFWVEVE